MIAADPNVSNIGIASKCESPSQCSEQPSPSAAMQGKEAFKNGANFNSKWRVLPDGITILFVDESFPEGLPKLRVAAVR